MDKSPNSYLHEIDQIKNIISRSLILYEFEEFSKFKKKENISESTLLIIVLQVLVGIFQISNVAFFSLFFIEQSLIYISTSELSIFVIFNIIWILSHKLSTKKISKECVVVFILSLTYINIIIKMFIILYSKNKIFTFDDLNVISYPLIIIGSSLILYLPCWNAQFGFIISVIDLTIVTYFSVKFKQYSNTASMIAIIFVSSVIFYTERKNKNKFIYDNYQNQQMLCKIFSVLNSSMSSLNSALFMFKNQELVLTTKKANEMLIDSANSKVGNNFTNQKIIYDNNISLNRRSEDIKLKLPNSPIPISKLAISNKICFNILPRSPLNIKRLFKNITPVFNLASSPNRNFELMLMCGMNINTINHGMELSNSMITSEPKNVHIIKHSNLYKILKHLSFKNKNNGENCMCFTLTSNFFNIGVFQLKPNYFEVLVKTEMVNNSVILNLIFNEIKDKTIETQYSETKSNFLNTYDIQKVFKKQVHEFKTPLISIVGSCEQLQKEVKDFSKNKQNIHFFINHIINISNYVKFLIKDILGRELDCLDFKLMNKKTKLNDILNFCSDILVSLLNCDEKKSKNIRPKLLNNLQNLNLLINVDEIRFKQIMLNFISNSVKFTNSGEIIIKSNISKKNMNILKISVQDSGIGIKAEILEPLKNGQSIKHKMEENNQFGTGLGLSIAQTFLKRMNMNFKIKSVENFGTKITLCIPNCLIENKIMTNFNSHSPNNIGENVIANEHNIIILPSRSSTDKCLNIYKNVNMLDDLRRRSNTIKESSKIDLNSNEEESYHNSIEDEAETKINSKLNGIQYSSLPQNFECEIFGTSSSNVVSPVEKVARINNRHFTFKDQNRDLISSINNIKNNININFTTNEYIQSSCQNLTSSNDKILVIDDLKIPRNSLANIIKNILQQSPNNYDVLEGSDGVDCLKFLMDYHKSVKCIFLDENMTYMNGTETAKIIRSFDRLGIRPFIVLISANDNEIDPILFDTALAKPIEKIDLIKVFEKYNIVSKNIYYC